MRYDDVWVNGIKWENGKVAITKACPYKKLMELIQAYYNEAADNVFVISNMPEDELVTADVRLLPGKHTYHLAYGDLVATVEPVLDIPGYFASEKNRQRQDVLYYDKYSMVWDKIYIRYLDHVMAQGKHGGKLLLVPGESVLTATTYL